MHKYHAEEEDPLLNVVPPRLEDVAVPLEPDSMAAQVALMAWGITYGMKRLPTKWPGPFPVPVDPVNVEGLQHVSTFAAVKTDGILMGLHLRWGVAGAEPDGCQVAVAMDRRCEPHVCNVSCDPAYFGAPDGYGTVVEGELVRTADGRLEYGIFDIWWWCGVDCRDMTVSEARRWAQQEGSIPRLHIDGVDRVYLKHMAPAHEMRRVWDTRSPLIPCDGLLLTPDVPLKDRYTRHPALKLKHDHTVDLVVRCTKCVSAVHPEKGELNTQILVACRNQSHGKTSTAMHSVFQVMMYDRDIIVRLQNNKAWRRFCKDMLRDMAYGQCRHVVVEFSARVRVATPDDIAEAVERDRTGTTAQYMYAMDIDLQRKAQAKVEALEEGTMERFAHEISLAHATGLEAAQGITGRVRDYGYYCTLVFQRTRPDKHHGNTYTSVALMLSSSMDMWEKIETTFLPPREEGGEGGGKEEEEEDVEMG